MKRCIVDADDFSNNNNRLDLLFRIKGEVPHFKITLFTILGKCTYSFIEAVKKIDWIDIVPHGWLHPHSRECENWTYKQSIEYLNIIEHFGVTKGFKAPGWQISDGTYQALLERGYWVADQEYNSERRPKDLKCYIINHSRSLHFHIQDVGGNGIEQNVNTIFSVQDSTFKFIKEVIIEEYNNSYSSS